MEGEELAQAVESQEFVLRSRRSGGGRRGGKTAGSRYHHANMRSRFGDVLAYEFPFETVSVVA